LLDSAAAGLAWLTNSCSYRTVLTPARRLARELLAKRAEARPAAAAADAGADAASAIARHRLALLAAADEDDPLAAAPAAAAAAAAPPAEEPEPGEIPPSPEPAPAPPPALDLGILAPRAPLPRLEDVLRLRRPPAASPFGADPHPGPQHKKTRGAECCASPSAH